MSAGGTEATNPHADTEVSPLSVKIKGSAAQGLILATLAFFAGFAGVSVFGPMVPKFSEIMQLSPVMAGLLVAIPNLTGSLLRIPFGAMVDRYGGKKPMLVLLILPLIGLPALIALMAFFYPNNLSTGMYPLLLVIGAVIGAGIASFSVGIAQVSYWFPQRKQGSALGIFGGLGNTAPGIFSWVLPVVVGALGITAAYSIWLALLGFVVVIYAIWAVDAPWFQLRCQTGTPPTAAAARACGQELLPSGGSWSALKDAAKDIRTWALTALYFTSFGGFLALTGWFPTYWHSYYDMPLVTGGLLTLVYSELASLTRVGTGFLSDKIGGEVVLLVSLVAMAVGAAAVAFSSVAAVSIVGMIVLGVSMGAQNAAIFKMVPKYASRSIGGASGWVGGLAALGGFAIPPIMGAVAQGYGQSGYALGFVVFLALSIISLGIALSLQKAGTPRTQQLITRSTTQRAS